MEKQMLFTAEECRELTTTLMSRIDDIAEMQKWATSEKDVQRVIYLQHIVDIHRSMLKKLTQ